MMRSIKGLGRKISATKEKGSMLQPTVLFLPSSALVLSPKKRSRVPGLQGVGSQSNREEEAMTMEMNERKDRTGNDCDGRFYKKKKNKTFKRVEREWLASRPISMIA